MADNNDNVIDFFKRPVNKEAAYKNSSDKKSEDKFYKKFPYVKLIKDNNGNFFNKESIREYSQKICYIVTVMRSNAPAAALYRYKVPHSSLCRFLNEFEKNAADGEIVDIEKYIPEDLA